MIRIGLTRKLVQGNTQPLCFMDFIERSDYWLSLAKAEFKVELL